MKNIPVACLLGATVVSAAAQVPSLCDLPAYASAFRARYPNALAVRQALGKSSDDEAASRLARLREATTASKQIDAAALLSFLETTAAQQDITDLHQEQQKADKSYGAFQKSFDVIPIMAGNDPVKQTRAFCLMGKETFVALGKKRKASEQIAALTQERLIAFGSGKGVVYSAELQPAPKACSSEAGSAAAEEQAEIYLDAARAEQRKIESELDAQIKVRSAEKGWSKQRVSEIFMRILSLPEFVALEEQKRPLTAEIVSWSQAGSDGPGGAQSTEPCTWPNKLISLLQQIAELNRRQYGLMAEEVRKAE